jgi:gluconate 2-dehydrogenase gamma chain
MKNINRRSVFHIIGSMPAVAALTVPGFAQKAPVAHAAYQRKVFDDRQWRAVHVLCDLIIPADEISGSATQAAVPEFIDDWLDFRNREDGNQNFTAQILGGLQWLDHESNALFQTDFARAGASQQKQILDRIAWPERAAPSDRPWTAFFSKFRDLTVSGFFSSKSGVADLPYLGNRAVAQWQGCDPKVWAIIEARMKTGYKGVGGEVKPLL